MTRSVRYLAQGALLTLLVFAAAHGARAQSVAATSIPVELELVLAVDTSASVDNSEFALQMNGIAAAFRHPAIITALKAYGTRGIAVTLVQWSAGNQQAQTVAWHQVNDAYSAERFAQSIEKTHRVFAVNTTAIGSALRFCGRLFANNGFEGRRRAIDVSGDGPSNEGLMPDAERDLVVAAGTTINGLAIRSNSADDALEAYYKGNVIGGPRAFVHSAAGFNDFARAILEKLLREIAPVVAEDDPDDPNLFAQLAEGSPFGWNYQ